MFIDQYISNENLTHNPTSVFGLKPGIMLRRLCVIDSGRDIFCLKNFDTFTRRPVRVSKMNAVARAH